MPTYAIHLVQTISTVVEVQADSMEDAMEQVYDSPDMPGSITVGAFGGASVDEAGEWTPVVVYADGNYDTPAWEADSR
jgi:hypothetical protein